MGLLRNVVLILCAAGASAEQRVTIEKRSSAPSTWVRGERVDPDKKVVRGF